MTAFLSFWRALLSEPVISQFDEREHTLSIEHFHTMALLPRVAAPAALLLILVIAITVNTKPHQERLRKLTATRSLIQDPKSIQTKNSQLPELVHIPKTGGSTLEGVAGKQGISWGLCHYLSVGWCPTIQPEPHYYDFNNYRSTTSVPQWWAPFWHIPPRYYRMLESSQNQEAQLFPNPYPLSKPLFAVVRNPYTRILSQWYYVTINNFKKTQEYANNADHMNEFVHKALTEFQKHTDPIADMTRENSYWIEDGHFIPQYDYIFDLDGKKIVQHVLKFESLQDDFNTMMSKYGESSLQLGTEHANKSNISDKKLSANDLTDANLLLIQRIYGKDFAVFGYERLIRPKNDAMPVTAAISQ